MARIYQADIWCDDCGKAIEARLSAEGKAPEDTLDEASYDSDNYPKYASDDDEADSPQHCAAGGDCLSPTIIGGERYGMFLHNALTPEGLTYVSEAAQRGGKVAEFWAGMYDGFCGPTDSKPCYRLERHPCTVCGGKVGRYDCEDGRHEDCAPMVRP